MQLKKKINEEGQGEAGQDTANIEQLQRDYTKNKEQVVDLLVKNVLSVNIEIPRVVKGVFNWEQQVEDAESGLNYVLLINIAQTSLVSCKGASVAECSLLSMSC